MEQGLDLVVLQASVGEVQLNARHAAGGVVRVPRSAEPLEQPFHVAVIELSQLVVAVGHVLATLGISPPPLRQLIG